MKQELSYQESLYFAALLEIGLREEDARAVAVAQSRMCGDRPMSPAEMDIYIPTHTMSQSTQVLVSDYLEEILGLGEDDVTSSIHCPVCGQMEEGTIAELGLFLLGHQIFHRFENRSMGMHAFGEEDDADDGEMNDKGGEKNGEQ